MPYLIIKKRQAEILLELGESKNRKYRKLAYWYNCKNGDWKNYKMIDSSEAAKILGYNHESILSRLIKTGTVLALPTRKNKWEKYKRFPKNFIIELNKLRSNGKFTQPNQLLNWKERLFHEIREINKLGISGTSIYHQRGCHKPK